MVSQVKKFMNDENQIFTEQARLLRRAPGKAVRGAAAKSAKRIRALQEPVRVVMPRKSRSWGSLPCSRKKRSFFL